MKAYKPSSKEVDSAYAAGWKAAENGFTGDVYNQHGCTHKELWQAWKRGNEAQQKGVRG